MKGISESVGVEVGSLTPNEVELRVVEVNMIGWRDEDWGERGSSVSGRGG